MYACAGMHLNAYIQTWSTKNGSRTITKVTGEKKAEVQIAQISFGTA
jgi:hypothetical protein